MSVGGKTIRCLPMHTLSNDDEKRRKPGGFARCNVPQTKSGGVDGLLHPEITGICYRQVHQWRHEDVASGEIISKDRRSQMLRRRYAGRGDDRACKKIDRGCHRKNPAGSASTTAQLLEQMELYVRRVAMTTLRTSRLTAQTVTQKICSVMRIRCDMMMFWWHRTKASWRKVVLIRVRISCMECDRLKDMLSKDRRLQIDRMQDEKNNLAAMSIFERCRKLKMASSLWHFHRGSE